MHANVLQTGHYSFQHGSGSQGHLLSKKKITKMTKLLWTPAKSGSLQECRHILLVVGNWVITCTSANDQNG